ncbi:MAG: hypothetical protein E7I00_00080, partial [Varibaculum cambriense]|nr:hypothetical protein [Varibaculum cambriense]
FSTADIRSMPAAQGAVWVDLQAISSDSQNQQAAAATFSGHVSCVENICQKHSVPEKRVSGSVKMANSITAMIPPSCMHMKNAF